MLVRAATRSDLPDLVAWGKLMHEESDYRTMPFDKEQIEKLAEMVFTCPSQFCAFMIEGEGFFVGQISESFFSKQKIAYDILLFVLPEKRGGSAAVKLIKAYEEWAQDNEAAYAQLGVTTGIDEHRTLCFYKRMGYNQFGTLVKKELPHVRRT